jgi:energy-coupling factor transporter ATP-binding protein EcfA2
VNKIVLVEYQNVLGLTEAKIEPGLVTLAEGGNGAGKSALIDGLLAAFSAKGIEGEVVTQGADKGRVLVKLSDGHTIRASFTPDGKRKVSVLTPDGDEKRAPQGWLDDLFGTSIINPVHFIELSPAEQRKVLLSALPIKVTQEDLQEWFGEAVPVDTDKHGLEVLSEIEKLYYERRKTANTQVKSLKSELEVVGKDIPEGFDAAEWESVDTGSLTQQLQDIGRIEAEKRQKLADADRIVRQADEWNVAAQQKRTKADGITAEIARLQALHADLLAQATEHEEGAAAEQERAEQVRAEADAIEVPDKTIIEEKLAAYSQAQRVLQQIQNRDRLIFEIEMAEAAAANLDKLVELARQKPKDLLAEASFPVEGLEFTEDDIRVNGLSIESLSSGEKLKLGVAIAKAMTGELGFICVDGAEVLDDANLQWLMAQADENHQFIITKVDAGELRVTTSNGDETQQSLFEEN